MRQRSGREHEARIALTPALRIADAMRVGFDLEHRAAEALLHARIGRNRQRRPHAIVRHVAGQPARQPHAVVRQVLLAAVEDHRHVRRAREQLAHQPHAHRPVADHDDRQHGRRFDRQRACFGDPDGGLRQIIAPKKKRPRARTFRRWLHMDAAVLGRRCQPTRYVGHDAVTCLCFANHAPAMAHARMRVRSGCCEGGLDNRLRCGAPFRRRGRWRRITVVPCTRAAALDVTASPELRAHSRDRAPLLASDA